MNLLIEIARREAELVALDNQMTELKGQTGCAGNLDAILALAEQKAELCRSLEELRQRCLAEEHKRLPAMHYLITEPAENLLSRITTDLAKYHKIASNQYARDMKGAAWDALVSGYPETKTIARHDVDAFLGILGFVLDEDRIVAARIKREDNLLKGENRSAASESKSEELIYTDPRTCLSWTTNGNIAGREMSWDDAKEWAKSLDYGGFRDWRLPSNVELASFVKPGGNNPIEYFRTNRFSNVQPDWYWSDTEDDDGIVWAVSMVSGQAVYSSKSIGGYVWPVREGEKKLKV